jgi:signal transduction histidine kinase
MEKVLRTIERQRAHTDASLDAERTAADSVEYLSEMTAQQEHDDLIEHDRIQADARLLKSRNNADKLLARDRSASPSKAGDSVAQERRIADQGKKVERAEMDAHMHDERERSDLQVEAERDKQELHQAKLVAYRQDTNDRLSTERHDSDTTAIDLGHTKDALALSEDQQARYGDVLGMVTHDLRSPLMTIAMSAEVIIDETQEPSSRKMAQLIRQASARMERLTADLLDVVRIQSGTLRITKQLQGVDALLTEILKTYGPLFANRLLSFTVGMPATAMVASFDYDRIVQVLSNLLGNAMKFTPQGGTVALHVQQLAQQVEFRVSNSGSGIAPGDLPHIFERFWQIDKHTRRGLGLGLYICKTIIEGHGGTIAAESEPGKGVTIRFTLPVS